MIEKQKSSILISQVAVDSPGYESTEHRCSALSPALHTVLCLPCLSLPAGPDDSGGKNVHDERLALYSLTRVASVE